jgi:AraC-like DNA-binding protein
LQIIDMAQELETKTHGLGRTERLYNQEEFINLSVIIAREHFEELVPTLHAMHLRVIPAGTPLNLILSNYILNLFSTASSLKAREAEGLVKPTAQLLAASLSRDPETVDFTRNSVDEALLLSVRRLIDHRLGDMTLSPDKIAAAMNISRATLFRICEPVGGVMNFVRQRRLALARRLLHSSNDQVPVKAIAYKLGFSNPSSFARAYRAEFGLSPSETKAIYQSDTHEREALASSAENGLDRRYEYWMSHIVR